MGEKEWFQWMELWFNQHNISITKPTYTPLYQFNVLLTLNNSILFIFISRVCSFQNVGDIITNDENNSDQILTLKWR